MTKEELIRKSREFGSHFFDDDAIRFFSSRLSSAPVSVEDKHYFVTSEKTWDGKERRYTVRCLDEKEEEIYDVSEFLQFATLRGAKAWMKKEVL